MRIGIDARFFGSAEGKGLGRYAQKLVEGLEKIDRVNEYFIFLGKSNFALYQPKNLRFHKILSPYPCYSWQEQLFFPKQLKKFNLDLVHFLHFNLPIFYSGRFVVTIHDLIHYLPGKQGSERNPFVYYLKKQIYKLVISQGLKKARKILTVSHFSQKQIVSLTKTDPAKIQVIYEATDFKRKGFLEENKDLKMLENSPYLLYVGNAYPHKNLNRLIQAFKIVNSSQGNLFLVLIGAKNSFFKKIQALAWQMSLSNQVIFTGKIPEAELVWLYQHASIYIFPSLMEGFGLPGLEAMSFGLPVISSNRGSLPEIYGSAALYFNPEDVQGMAKKIFRVLNNPDLRETLVKKGLEQVKKYSWQKTAQETLNIYQSINV